MVSYSPHRASPAYILYSSYHHCLVILCSCLWYASFCYTVSFLRTEASAMLSLKKGRSLKVGQNLQDALPAFMEQKRYPYSSHLFLRSLLKYYLSEKLIMSTFIETVFPPPAPTHLALFFFPVVLIFPWYVCMCLFPLCRM